MASNPTRRTRVLNVADGSTNLPGFKVILITLVTVRATAYVAGDTFLVLTMTGTSLVPIAEVRE